MEKSTDIKFVTIPSGKMSSSVIVLDALTNELPVLKWLSHQKEVIGQLGKRLELDTIFTLPLKVVDGNFEFAGSETLYFYPTLALLRRLVIELFSDWIIDDYNLEKLTKAINEATTKMTVGEMQQLAQRAYSLCVDWKCKLEVRYTYENELALEYPDTDVTCDGPLYNFFDEIVLHSNSYEVQDGYRCSYTGAIILPVVNEF